MDKIDKEVLYWSIWKLINYVYAITIILSIAFGVRTMLYLVGGMEDESISQNGLITLWSILVFYIIFRNAVKPFFKRKTNNSLDENY